MPEFHHFDAKETIICENQKTLKIIVYITYQGKTKPFYQYVMPFNQEDKAEERQDLKSVCKIINQEINPLIKGKDVLGLKKIDEILLAYQKKQAENGVVIPDLLVKACSESLLYCYGACTSPADPFLSIYKYLKNSDFSSSEKSPKLIFTVLNGGKALASKVRFSRFYLILEVSHADEVDPTDLFLKIQAQLRKQIAAHKLGENGFKPGADGSYYNAFENVNESFKFLEDAITATQINTEKRKYLKIGLNPDIDSYFIKEQGKYDLEGPKNLFDADQVTEYFIKMCNEHPLLEYIEDPLAEGDVRGYQRLLNRFKDGMPRCQIGVKNWFKSSIDNIKQHTQIITKDDDDDDNEEVDKKKKQQEEEKKKEEVKEVPPPVQEPPKAGGRDSTALKKGTQSDLKTAVGGRGSQAKLEPVQPELAAIQEDPNDPNKNKFIPNVIHIERSQLKTYYKIWELILYQQQLKPEERFEIMIEDYFYENTNAEIIDLAFGGSIGFVNIRGFFRNEKTQKVLRYSEILDSIRQIYKKENETE